jgi:hypothetical protein
MSFIDFNIDYRHSTDDFVIGSTEIMENICEPFKDIIYRDKTSHGTPVLNYIYEQIFEPIITLNNKLSDVLLAISLRDKVFYDMANRLLKNKYASLDEYLNDKDLRIQFDATPNVTARCIINDGNVYTKSEDKAELDFIFTDDFKAFKRKLLVKNNPFLPLTSLNKEYSNNYYNGYNYYLYDRRNELPLDTFMTGLIDISFNYTMNLEFSSSITGNFGTNLSKYSSFSYNSETYTGRNVNYDAILEDFTSEKGEAYKSIEKMMNDLFVTFKKHYFKVTMIDN